MLPDTTVRRLAFIKYLFEKGVQQARQPEPLCGLSILVFHDAVEMFLHLACEHVDAEPAREFMDYWERLKSKVAGGGVTQKAGMQRLNKARAALKHSGVLPSRHVVEELTASTTVFFSDNTPTIFGVAFDQISLVDLVSCEACKTDLEKAVSHMSSGALLEAMDSIALSFEELLDDYQNRKKDRFGHSPFFFGRDFAFSSSFFMRIDDKRLAAFIDQVKETLEAMQTAMKILAVGLDYRRYCRFRMLVPRVARMASGTYTIDRLRDEIPTPDECKFCLDFVIESGLHLQTYDW